MFTLTKRSLFFHLKNQQNNMINFKLETILIDSEWVPNIMQLTIGRILEIKQQNKEKNYLNVYLAFSNYKQLSNLEHSSFIKEEINLLKSFLNIGSYKEINSIYSIDVLAYLLLDWLFNYVDVIIPQYKINMLYSNVNISINSLLTNFSKSKYITTKDKNKIYNSLINVFNASEFETLLYISRFLYNAKPLPNSVEEEKNEYNNCIYVILYSIIGFKYSDFELFINNQKSNLKNNNKIGNFEKSSKNKESLNSKHLVVSKLFTIIDFLVYLFSDNELDFLKDFSKSNLNVNQSKLSEISNDIAIYNKYFNGTCFSAFSKNCLNEYIKKDNNVVSNSSSNNNICLKNKLTSKVLNNNLLSSNKSNNLFKSSVNFNLSILKSNKNVHKTSINNGKDIGCISKYSSNNNNKVLPTNKEYETTKNFNVNKCIFLENSLYKRRSHSNNINSSKNMLDNCINYCLDLNNSFNTDNLENHNNYENKLISELYYLVNSYVKHNPNIVNKNKCFNHIKICNNTKNINSGCCKEIFFNKLRNNINKLGKLNNFNINSNIKINKDDFSYINYNYKDTKEKKSLILYNTDYNNNEYFLDDLNTIKDVIDINTTNNKNNYVQVSDSNFSFKNVQNKNVEVNINSNKSIKSSKKNQKMSLFNNKLCSKQNIKKDSNVITKNDLNTSSNQSFNDNNIQAFNLINNNTIQDTINENKLDTNLLITDESNAKLLVENKSILLFKKNLFINDKEYSNICASNNYGNNINKIKVNNIISNKETNNNYRSIFKLSILNDESKLISINNNANSKKSSHTNKAIVNNLKAKTKLKKTKTFDFKSNYKNASRNTFDKNMCYVPNKNSNKFNLIDKKIFTIKSSNNLRLGLISSEINNKIKLINNS